jgi:carboxypeptidase C (cathepsin A)
MKSCKLFGTAVMTAALVSLTAVQPVLAYDGVRRVPYPVVPNSPPPTEQSSWDAMQRNIQRRFNDASGGGNSLTQDQARRAGWGWLVDNFPQIDRQGTGHVSLDDINRFLQDRWLQHSNAAAPNWSPWNGGEGHSWDDHPNAYPYERDVQFIDANKYDTTVEGTIALKAVTEQASLKQHTMTINGRSVTFTARAGHLTASKVDSTGKTATISANGQTTPGSTPEATMFYTAYTRDDLPKHDRPVTFFWNGGPGSSSIWLHMGSFGPQFLDTNAPIVPVADDKNPPASFPLQDNPITLLDETDLVFVDPPGTGLSTAIAPNVNQTFWGTDADAQVVADFVTRYINVYNRQSSPKYLYGESYGGIRTPIVANILEHAGTADYLPGPPEQANQPWDRDGGKSWDRSAKVLNGVVLGSPILDYSTNCGQNFGAVNCNSFIPNMAMVQDYLGLSSARGSLSREAYFKQVSDYVNSSDFAAYNSNCSDWSYIGSPAAQKVIQQIQVFLGGDLGLYWGIPITCDGNRATGLGTVVAYLEDYIGTYSRIASNFSLTVASYDGRLLVPSSANYLASDFPNTAFYNQLIAYLTTYANYSNKPAGETGQAANSDYQPENLTPVSVCASALCNKTHWNFSHDNNNYAESVTDIHSALTADPSLKFMVLHGWDDFVCPETQTLWDLENAKLSNIVPIHTFEGGHMTYETDSSRIPLKNALVSFYRSTTTGAQSGTCDREASR